MRRVLITSATAFAVASLVQLTVHELAHGVAGVLTGGHPTVYGFSVEQGAQTDGRAITTALAGPVVSLVVGLVLLAVRGTSLPPFWRLLLLWSGAVGVQSTAGYLITGPFVAGGDVGRALSLSGAPAAVGWAGFVAGWAGTYLLGRLVTRRLVAMTDPDRPLAPQLRALGLLAWLLGSGVVVLVSLGLLSAGGVGAGVVVFEALGVISSGLFLVFVRLFLGRVDRTSRAGRPVDLPVVGLVLLVVLAVARQVLLGAGLAL